jgi:hypothetical protein
VLALVLRLAVIGGALAGLFLLFVYAFVVAIVLAPIAFLVVLILARTGWLKVGRLRWAVVVRRPPNRSQGPVIDHDPHDLPHQPQG